ncbi:MAG: hypothetical protein GC159_21220 [Phycisphaera sp.]|nr:hypothetical protein [Phycisphaera sp.]
MKRHLPLCAAAMLGLLYAAAITPRAHAADPIDLIDAKKPRGGWKLNLGQEFPGAKGSLDLAAEPFEGRPVLKLDSDFTGGGAYIDAGVDLPRTPLDTITFHLKAPAGVDGLPIRLVDGTGQAHQLKVRIQPTGEWQRVVLPVRAFFDTMGTPDAINLTTQYQNWGGANDGRWHQPGRLMTILATRDMGKEPKALLIRDVQLQPYDVRTSVVRASLPINELLAHRRTDWQLNLGVEYAGAKGDLTLLPDQPQPGTNAMHLWGDFTGGGRYVGIKKAFDLPNTALDAIRLKLRSTDADTITVRLVDGSGQTHQQRNVKITADGQWHEVTFEPRNIAGGEHWGGANNGRWHDPVRHIEFMVTDYSDKSDKKAELDFADMSLDVRVVASVAPSAVSAAFDNVDTPDALPDGWRGEGDVHVAKEGHRRTPGSLELTRTLDNVETKTAVTGPRFAVAPGQWRIGFGVRADLHSPDNSYNAPVELDVFDSAGRKLDTLPLALGYGKTRWTDIAKSVELPAGAATASVRIALNKTYGSFCFDELTASPVRLGVLDRKVNRTLLDSDAVGNLFVPGAPVVIHATIEASRPLSDTERVVRYSLRDAEGAEAIAPGEITLTESGDDADKFIRTGGAFTYRADITLPADRLAVGRFYQLHTLVPQTGEPAEEFTGLALLPIAASKRYKPAEIPFTIRNWDGRIPAYYAMADRLGIRQIGLWGGWSEKAPYDAHLNGIDEIEKLEAGWLVGTPASNIEDHGFKKYSEESLREGMTNFLKAYGKRGMIGVCLGNEPHGTGQKVLDNVKAYKAVYEAAKAYDPNVFVMGTSVEPNREYFEAGYYNYLDAYDFHIYEHYTNVRKTMQEYRALMKEFNAVKPIHSTELGLNSLGQTRRAVSIEMVKKLTVFFAEGGSTVSWFTIQYPDGEGKARGTFGNAHCVFDCQYSRYNPRLDAITEYHLINSFLDKKFVAEKQYDTGVQAYRFADDKGHRMTVLWRDAGRLDVQLPLGDNAGPVNRLLIDGSSATLTPRDGAVTLTVDNEPIVLMHDGPAAMTDKLPDALPAATIHPVDTPAAAHPGAPLVITLEAPGLTAASLRAVGPALWHTKLEQAGDNRVSLHVDVPANTPARKARYVVQRVSGDKVSGETIVTLPVE